MKLRIIALVFFLVSFGIVSTVSAEKMWGDKGYGEYLEFTEDNVTPGIIVAPSWPDVPINNPGFNQLLNSVADGPFSGIPAITYSDVENIRPDINGQSWEESYLPPPQFLITIGEMDSPFLPNSNNEGNGDSSPSIIPSDESAYHEFPRFITPAYKDNDNFRSSPAGQWLIDNWGEREYVIVQFTLEITLTDAKNTIQNVIPGIFHSIQVESDKPPLLKVRLSTDGEAKWLMDMLEQQYGIVEMRQKTEHAPSCGDCSW